MTVIDLDEPAQRRPQRAGRPRLGWRRGCCAAALLGVGALIGASGTYGWTTQRLQDSRASQVSVLVFAKAQSMLGVSGEVRVGGRVTTTGILGQLMIVNAGPVPINVEAVRVDAAGLTVRTMTRERRIEPGGAVQADADVQVDCAVAGPIAMLEASLRVETFDERVRELPAALRFDGAPWNEPVQRACAGKG